MNNRAPTLFQHLSLLLVFAVGALSASISSAANVQFTGSVSYTYAGNVATLTANRVDNFSTGGTSGTLRMELWALPSPYSGALTFGYKLAQTTLGQLFGGFYFAGISSGAVPFVYPPNGTWAVAMILTEYDFGPTNGGYSVRDWINFSNPLVIGPPVSPGQLAFSPTSLNFGNVTVGTTSVSRTVMVTNVGGLPVAISSAGLTSANGFAAYTNCPAVLFPGASCVGTATFSPPVTGSLSSAVIVISDGVGSPQSVPLYGTGVSVTTPPPTTATAVEYRHAGFDHYFVTAITDEISKLDSGFFAGWTRTGQTFKVYVANQASLASVCRFFSTAFGVKSSHFYTPDSSECAVVTANPNWQFEGVVFYMVKANAIGNCPSGTQPIYRTYNNGQGGAPNHRYMSSLSVRAQMLNLGWIPEGYGNIGVIMCAPL